MTFDELVPHWNGFFKERVFFSYYRCPSCGLLYAPTFFDDEQLSSLYSQMPPNMELVPTAALRKTQRGYFETLKRYGSLSGGYLEVGPDIGLLAENCAREGSFSDYWLYEPNRSVTQALAAAVDGNRHHIIHDMFGFGATPDEAVDVVTMIHVLDHLLDPRLVLKELHRTLRASGTIVIVTHNEDSILRHIFRRNWPAFCLQHPQIYSPSSMRKLLESCGFEVETIRRTVNYFPLQFLVMHLLWALGVEVEKLPELGGALLGLKLGNMITVARRTDS